MKLTIVYDNESLQPGLATDWGFACVIEAHGRTILFDTGAKGQILLANMARLGIEPRRIDEVFISHHHGDHVGGLADFLKLKRCPVYIPSSCSKPHGASEVFSVDQRREIHSGIYSTGTLKRIEQSLVLASESGAVVVAGCSHPGVGEILDAASHIARPRALIGGLHGFSDFKVIDGLELVCPLHCTKHKEAILQRYPEIATAGGAGLVLEL